jgi:hypothetical protein
LFLLAMAVSTVDLFLFNRLKGWERTLVGREFSSAAAAAVALALYVIGLMLILNALKNHLYPPHTYAGPSPPVSGAADGKWRRQLFVPSREAAATDLQPFGRMIWLMGFGGLLISASVLWTLVRFAAGL